MLRPNIAASGAFSNASHSRHSRNFIIETALGLQADVFGNAAVSSTEQREDGVPKMFNLSRRSVCPDDRRSCVFEFRVGYAHLHLTLGDEILKMMTLNA
ncbi:Protein of unknown function [Gryllus bimaculatus]|nr:Protein of unknown function [Gryllus bimaculatus]